jgi:hypothetical protein
LTFEGVPAELSSTELILLSAELFSDEALSAGGGGGGGGAATGGGTAAVSASPLSALYFSDDSESSNCGEIAKGADSSPEFVKGDAPSDSPATAGELDADSNTAELLSKLDDCKGADISKCYAEIKMPAWHFY